MHEPVSRYQEKDNMGWRQETLSQVNSYWTARNLSQRLEPFVLFVFEDESDARQALLELDCIHEAGDTGNLICTEVLTFGYYRADSGSFEAIVSGEDLTRERWESARESFSRHHGKSKSEQAPLESGDGPLPEKEAEPGAIEFLRIDHQKRMGNTLTYVVHQGPDKVAALAFLESHPVNDSLYYVVVETPEGNYCRDIQGIYQE